MALFENHTWQALAPWLGDLLGDQAPVHARCNLAMLAADLAPNDEQALEDLSRMVAQTFDKIVREVSTEERTLLDTLLLERVALPEEVQERLDSRVASQLETLISEWDPDHAYNALVRTGQSATTLLPPKIMADVVVFNARRLVALERNSPERDIHQRRLYQLARIDASAPEQLRSKWRALIRSQFEHIRRRQRRLALFGLMQVAPAWLRSSADGTAIANPAEMDAAARVGRPRHRWLIWQALLGAVIGGGVLSLLILPLMIKFDNPLKNFTDFIDSWVNLAIIGFPTGLLVGFFYTPSVGRQSDLLRTLWRALIPAAAGSIGVVFAVMIYIVWSPDELGLNAQFTNRPILTIVSLYVCSLVVLVVVTRLAPIMTRIVRERTVEGAAVLTTLFLAGPVIVVAMAICGTAILLHEATLTQIWPELMVAVAATATVVATVELETWPTLRREVPKAPRPGLLVASLVACSLPVLLSLSHLALRYLPWFRDQLTVSAPQRSGDQPVGHSYLVLPGHVLTLIAERDVPVRISVDAGTHQALHVTSGNPARATQFRLASGDQICVDRCWGWPPMSEWLPSLFEIIAPLHLRAEAAQSPPTVAKTLIVEPDRTLSDTIEAGATNHMILQGEGLMSVKFAVEGAGNHGDLPFVALYDGSKQLQLPYQELSSKGKTFEAEIPGGDYILCVYFGDADTPGCDPKNTNREIFESGSANLQVTSRLISHSSSFAGQPLTLSGTAVKIVTNLYSVAELIITSTSHVNVAVTKDSGQGQRDLYLSVLDKHKQRILADQDDPDPPQLTVDLLPGIYFVCVSWSSPRGQCNPREKTSSSSTSTAEVGVNIDAIIK
jgi:hypothetical protein